MKKTVIALTFALGLMATGCGIGGSSSGQAPTTNIENNTVTPSGTANTPSGGTSNNTSNDVGNNTDGTGTVEITPANTTGTNTTAPSTTGLAVTSASGAEAIVRTMYAPIQAKDKNLTVHSDHTTKQDGHTVYVVHVYDNMPDHIATISWIDVRDDGKVQNDLTPNGWVEPSQYSVQ